MKVDTIRTAKWEKVEARRRVRRLLQKGRQEETQICIGQGAEEMDRRARTWGW